MHPNAAEVQPHSLFHLPPDSSIQRTPPAARSLDAIPQIQGCLRASVGASAGIKRTLHLAVATQSLQPEYRGGRAARLARRDQCWDMRLAMLACLLRPRGVVMLRGIQLSVAQESCSDASYSPNSPSPITLPIF